MSRSTHVHGRPDNQQENLDDILGRGKGDFDMPSGQRWIGVDMPQTLKIVDDSVLIGRNRRSTWRLPEDQIDYDSRFDEDLSKFEEVNDVPF